MTISVHYTMELESYEMCLNFTVAFQKPFDAPECKWGRVNQTVNMSHMLDVISQKIYNAAKVYCRTGGELCTIVCLFIEHKDLNIL